MNKNIIAIIFMVHFTACGNFFEQKNSNGANDSISNVPTSITFEEVRAKIFTPQCIECHVQYADYDFVKKDAQAILNSVLINRMPKNKAPLSSDLKTLLQTWIEAGAPNTVVVDGPVGEEPVDEDKLVPTWSSLSKNIFIPKCVVCHNPNGQAPWVDVSNREGMAKTLIKHINFKEIEKSNLLLRLADTEEPMPPLPPDSNTAQLTSAEIDVVREWIKAGIP